MQTLRYPYDGPPYPVLQQFSKKKEQQAEEIRYNNELERFYATYPEEREIFLANQHIDSLELCESEHLRCLTYYAPWVADRYYIEYPVQDNRGNFCPMKAFHEARTNFFVKTRNIIDIEILNYDIFIYDFLRSNGLDRFKATYRLIDWMLCDRPVMYADGTFDEADKMPVRDVWQASVDDPNISEQEILDMFKVFQSDYLESVVRRVDEGVYNDYEKQLMNLLFEAYRNEIKFYEIADQESVLNHINDRISGIIARMHYVERKRRIAAQNRYIASLNEQNSVFIEKTDLEENTVEAEANSSTEEAPEADNTAVIDEISAAEDATLTDQTTAAEDVTLTDEIPEAENSSLTDENSEPEQPLVQKIHFCSKCGRKTDDNPESKFCAGCGALIG